MYNTVPIVEGSGEDSAIQLLLRRILHEQFACFDLQVDKPINAKGRGGLTSIGGIERYVALASARGMCHAILVLLDADDDCAVALSKGLADRIRNIPPRCPVAVVSANRMYEAWFLASLHTLAGEKLGGRSALIAGTEFDGDVELVPNPKEWLTSRFPSGRIYKPTQDMAPMTARLDLPAVTTKSRSFRRLVNAVLQLSENCRADARVVTP